jgi:predicted nucleic acid-binding protein
VRLVAGANVLLSVVIGGRGKAVVYHSSINEVFAAEAMLAEVQDYATLLVASLPASVVERATYEKSIPEAKRRIGRRDPDGVDVVALALHAGAPVWSNDNDFEHAGVEWFTTAALLAKLN